jgi:hypothetical protein
LPLHNKGRKHEVSPWLAAFVHARIWIEKKKTKFSTKKKSAFKNSKSYFLLR